VRFVIGLPETQTLSSFAVSADGRRLAYSAEVRGDGLRRIFVKELAQNTRDARALANTPGGSHPFFSPDGSSIGYLAGGFLWRTRVDGSEPPRRVAEAASETAGATWTEDGRIVFGPMGNQGLQEVPAEGGTVTALTTLNERDSEISHGWPHALEGGAIVFTVSEQGRDPHIEVLAPDKTRKRLRVPIAGQAQFVDSGHLVYSYLGNLMAVRFERDNLRTVDVPSVIAKDVQTLGGFGTLGRAGFSVSRNGTLAWLRATREDVRSTVVRVTRDGRSTPLPISPETFQTPRMSPDGRHLALVVRSGMMTREIRVVAASQPDKPVLVVQGGDNQSPAWMDARRLSFGSNREGPQKIYTLTIGGKSPSPLFTANVSAARNPGSWSRTPQLLVLYEIDTLRRRDVLVYRPGQAVLPVAATSANERSPSVSPDGRWVAFVSDQSGRDQVYVKPLDVTGGEPLAITSAGASEPVWTGDGLYYREGDRMMLVGFAAGRPGEPRALFEGHFERDPGANSAAYDVDPRNPAFIMLKSALAVREVRVVQNWGTELLSQLGAP
jgi:serine/threonine-protein kinase